MLKTTLTDPAKEALRAAFNKLLPDCLFMSHYELQEVTDIDADLWKAFLIDPIVNEYITSELRMVQQAEYNKILKDISKLDKAKSQGVAQVVGALSKTLETQQQKSGPIFIVMNTPFTEEERKAPNVVTRPTVLPKP